jgi:hypothetical protein
MATAYALVMFNLNRTNVPALLALFVASSAITIGVETDARACTAPAPAEGYITSVQFTRLAVGDTASPLACKPQQKFVGECPQSDYYEKLRGVLAVRVLAQPTPKPGVESGYIARKFDSEASTRLKMKDASGAVIEIGNAGTGGAPFSVFGSTLFSKVGATLCITTDPPPGDAGAPDSGPDGGAAPSEYCVPVPATDLTVTPAELSANKADGEACIIANRTQGDGGGVAPDGGAQPDGGRVEPGDGYVSGSGCSTAPTAGAAWLAVLPIAAALLALRKRRAARR